MGLAEEIGGVVLGGGATPEHPAEFGDAGGGFETFDAGFGAAGLDFLADDEVGGGVGGDGCEVGDAQHLMVAGDAAHLGADGMGGLAADIGIDLIEHEDGDLILGGEDGLEGEHDAGELAGGSDAAERACGFAGIGGEEELALVETGGGAGGGGIVSGGRPDGGFESGLAEAKGSEFGFHGAGQLRGDLASAGGEGGRRAGEGFGQGFEPGLEVREGALAAFQGIKFRLGTLPEGEDVIDGGAVLAAEGLDEVESFLEPGEVFGIQLDVAGVAGEVLLEIAEEGGGLLVLFEEGTGVGIEAGKVGEEAAEAAEAGQEGVLLVGEGGGGGLGEFEDPGSVGGALVIGGEGLVLAGLEMGSADLVGLVAEEIELPGVGLFVDHEGGLLGFEGEPAGVEGGEGGAGFLEVSEGVKDGKLAGWLEEGLMFVGAVEVHQEGTEGGEGGQGGGRAVDELPVGAVRGEGSLQHEDAGVTGVEALVEEEGIERGLEQADVEDRLDRAEVGAGADGTTVRALPEDELDGAEDDGLASAGLAGDGIEARLEFKGEVRDEGQVPDSKRGQHQRRSNASGSFHGGGSGFNRSCGELCGNAFMMGFKGTRSPLPTVREIEATSPWHGGEASRLQPLPG